MQEIVVFSGWPSTTMISQNSPPLRFNSRSASTAPLITWASSNTGIMTEISIPYLLSMFYASYYTQLRTFFKAHSKCKFNRLMIATKTLSKKRVQFDFVSETINDEKIRSNPFSTRGFAGTCPAVLGQTVHAAGPKGLCLKQSKARLVQCVRH